MPSLGELMRKLLLVLLVLTIVASASKGLASTDCEKWLAEYKKELAHKQSVQRALGARNRARAYARGKVGHLIAPAVAPAPHPVRSVTHRPHLTPAQMLKRFDLMCGDLPVGPVNQVLDGRMAPDEFISEVSMGGPIETESAVPGTDLLSSEEPVPYTSPASTPGGNSGLQPIYPIYGPQPGGGLSTSAVIPPTVLPIVPPISSVPEPGSLALMLTGAAGALTAMKRRLNSAA